MNPDPYKIRFAEKKDIDKLVDLVVRLKKLNEEFDPLYAVREDIVDATKNYLANSFDREDVFILVAESGEKIIGLIRVEIRSRVFYQPLFEGVITDLYVCPVYRNKGVGGLLIEEAINVLRGRGISLVSAEFPPMNKIAVDFYQKKGFKPLLYKFFKEI
ncbi:MAG: GNAT family N-acetyltransferase [Sulfolobales archaeon]